MTEIAVVGMEGIPIGNKKTGGYKREAEVRRDGSDNAALFLKVCIYCGGRCSSFKQTKMAATEKRGDMPLIMLINNQSVPGWSMLANSYSTSQEWIISLPHTLILSFLSIKKAVTST